MYSYEQIVSYETAAIGLSGSGSDGVGFSNALPSVGPNGLGVLILVEVKWESLGAAAGDIVLHVMSVPDHVNVSQPAEGSEVNKLCHKVGNWNSIPVEDPTVVSGSEPADGVWRGVFFMPSATSNADGGVGPIPHGHFHVRLTNEGAAYPDAGVLQVSKIVVYG